ncbi:transmembrane protein 92 isoform X1 [Bufo bufo]|uniref:transmembrane protein 92 isoform X1 n=1 Tax=Bufo bufo TaxID=8384 RepID=UPI001ABEA190|nr:transmembrane protein 92 isoform X1 [Bufo bufo]
MSKEERGRETDRQDRGCEQDRSEGRRKARLDTERQRPPRQEADMEVNSFQMKICIKLLAGCLVPVGASKLCRVTECLDGSSCCDSEAKVYLDYSWYGPLFICMLIMFSVLCLCGICNNVCRFRNRSTPPSPRDTPLINMGAPPPYEEVTAKPFLYPPSTSSPPSYSSVILNNPDPTPPVLGVQSR